MALNIKYRELIAVYHDVSDFAYAVNTCTAHSVVGAQSTALYPFGTQAGDNVAQKQDDACDDQYNQKISMFGNQFQRLYVRNIRFNW